MNASNKKILHLFLICAFIAPVLNGCATTINQSVVTTVASTSESTIQATIDSRLTLDELLDELLLAVNDLSSSMQQAERRQVANQLAQVVLLSEATRPKILAISDQLAYDFDRVIELAKSSVERNRPADADKALRFLPLIIESLKP